MAGLWLGCKLNVPDSRVAAIVQSSRLERLRAAGELTTVVSRHETTITPSVNTELFGLKTGETVLSYRAAGEVRVGVDLSRLSPESIQQSKSGVTVFLPPPTVFSVALLDGQTVATEHRGVYVDEQVAASLRDEVDHLARQAILLEACRDSRIRENAKTQAQAVIRSFFPRQRVVVQFAGEFRCSDTLLQP